MTAPCVNRLLVVGPARTLRAFIRDDRWTRGLGAGSFDLLECAPRRHAWQFETDAPPVAWLRRESRGWPALGFVLDYDREARRGSVPKVLQKGNGSWQGGVVQDHPPKTPKGIP
jgi:hypothetical protein